MYLIKMSEAELQQDSATKHPQGGCLFNRAKQFGASYTEAAHLANEVPDCLSHHAPITPLWNALLVKVMKQGGRKTLLATDNLRLNLQPYDTRA